MTGVILSRFFLHCQNAFPLLRPNAASLSGWSGPHSALLLPVDTWLPLWQQPVCPSGLWFQRRAWELWVGVPPNPHPTPSHLFSAAAAPSHPALLWPEAPIPHQPGGCLTDPSKFSVSAAGSEGQFPSFIQATVCTQQVKTTCIRRAFPPPEAWPRVLTCWSSSQDLGSGVSLSDGNGFPVSAEDWDYPYLCQAVTSVPR